MKRIATALCGVLLLAAPGEGQPRDLRSVELFDYDCSSNIGRRQVTLFANGTVRFRLWSGEEEPEMRLEELDPDELAGYVNRLREIDLSESEEQRESLAGEWIQKCELVLDLWEGAPEDDREPQPNRFRFGRYDSVSLALSRIIRIVEEISLRAEETATAAEFPSGYEPAPGDVLERRDGVLFEVIALTSDQRGVELWGVDQPLVVYVLREELIGEFVRVVEGGSER